MSGNFDDSTPRWPERDRSEPREPERSEPEPREPERTQPERRDTQRYDTQRHDWHATDSPAYEPGRTLPTPEVEAAEPTTSLGDGGPRDPDDPGAGDGGWDPRRDGDRRRPTTAEQAVPWLIGLLLAMTGIVVVLLALIFVGPEGVAAEPTPSPSSSAAPTFTPIPLVTSTPLPTAGPTATPPPTYGPLEMVFLGRSTASAPIRLLRRDFTTTAEPVVIAEDDNGVKGYSWAPDGRIGAAIIDGRAVALVEGEPLRTLTDPVDAIAFADDSTTLYGLRIVRDGANDRAEVLTIEFETGTTEVLTTISYPHPQIIADPPLKEAQYADNGGIVRLWSTIDGYVVVWIQGAPATYRIDPEDGTYTEGERRPVLWSPDQRKRIDVSESGTTTTLTVRDRAEVVVSSVTVSGLVSHIRWAGTNNEIVFTLGRTVGGGVRQDLYVWDLVDDRAPSPLTSNGASFGAEWLGVLQSWLP